MKKMILILLAGVAILLCSCKDQLYAVVKTSDTAVETTWEEKETDASTAETVPTDASGQNDSTASGQNDSTVSKPAATESSAPRLAVKPPLIDEKQFLYDGPPEKRSYEDVVSRAVGKVVESEGTFAASPVIWSTISDQDFVYFFYRFTGEVESEEQELSDYVIVGEEIELSCGIHTGMTIEEAEDLLPDLYHFRWDAKEERSQYRWNNGTYPEGFAEQFPTILIAQADQDQELPLYVGFMADETGVIRAIAFCNPTAG